MAFLMLSKNRPSLFDSFNNGGEIVIGKHHIKMRLWLHRFRLSPLSATDIRALEPQGHRLPRLPS